MDNMKEEILEKLRQVRDTAYQNLKNQEGYENSVVQNVIYYGPIELINKETGEKEQHELYTVEIYDYEEDQISTRIYLDGQEIDMLELQRTYEDIQPIKEEINRVREEQEQTEDKDSKSVVYDLNELEKEKEEEERETEEKKEEEEEILDEEEVKDLKISNAKGKVDLNQMVNGVTIRNIIGLDADYTYIAPVTTSSLNLEGTNANYTFVALKEDGTAKILHGEFIREDRQEGINSFNKDKFVGNDGRVEQKSAVSNYVIGNGKYALSIYHDEGTSSMATTITKRSGRENTEGEIDKELHHQGDKKIDSDARDSLREKNGIGEYDDMRERQESHEDKECENDRVENIDNDQTNDLHFHITDEQLDELADNTGENKDVLKERFEREVENHPDANPEQIIKIIEEDYDRLQSHNHEQ